MTHTEPGGHSSGCAEPAGQSEARAHGTGAPLDAGQKLPCGHCAGVAACAGQKLPAGHGRATVEFSGHHVAGRHDVRCDGSAQNDPAGQAPGAALRCGQNALDAHGCVAEALTGQKYPAGQSRANHEPAGQNAPAGQSVCIELFAHSRPGGQGANADEPLGQKSPSRHGSGALAFAEHKNPGGQTSWLSACGGQ